MGRGAFQSANSRGTVFRLSHVLLCVNGNAGLSSSSGCTRLGVIIAKKHCRGAVERNTFRRRVRDVFRRNKEAFPPAADVLVVASEGAAATSYEDLQAEMLTWAAAYAAGTAQARGGEGRYRPIVLSLGARFILAQLVFAKNIRPLFSQ